MKRWVINLTIGTYLSVLSFGVFAHAFNIFVGSHPGMYMIVWDMFCGWNAWETRLHVVAEGESGEHYRVTPAPWGTIHPYGNLSREHYLANRNPLIELGQHVLENTQHEPIVRMFVVEESWSKKFNLPDVVWETEFEEEREVNRYYRVQAVVAADGQILHKKDTWLSSLQAQAFLANPRLTEELSKSVPVFANGGGNRSLFQVAPAAKSNQPAMYPSAN